MPTELTLADQISEVKTRLIRKEISYDAARSEAQPILDEMNRRARLIATKYKRKHAPFSFEKMMRAL